MGIDHYAFGPAWLILLVWMIAAVVVAVPLGIFIDEWLEKRRQRREAKRSIIWRG